MSDYLTEQEKDRLLAERQQMIEALLNYINNLLKERYEAGDERALSVRSLSDYIAEGGSIKRHPVNALQAERAAQLFKFFKVDFAELSRNEDEQGCDYIDFVTRSDQTENVGKVLELMEFEQSTRLCWVGIEDFLRCSIGSTVDRFTIPEERTSDLTQELSGSSMVFSVNFLAGGRADVYFLPKDRQQMTECAIKALEDAGITDDIRISEHKIDSEYTAKTMAQDREREKTDRKVQKRHIGYASLSL